MKRILILLLTACMIAAAFVGCANKPEKLPSDGFGLTSKDTNGNWLRDDVELEILKYKFGNKVDPKDWWVRYFGTYNNMIVLWLEQLNTGNMVPIGETWYDTIAELEFAYGSRYWIWADNQLYKLNDAYEMGIFTDEDVRHIHQRYALQYHFYGPYSGATVCVMNLHQDPDNVFCENIGGVEFYYNAYIRYIVFHNDGSCMLKEAYESGVLTIEDIKAFHDDYSNARFYAYE